MNETPPAPPDFRRQLLRYLVVGGLAVAIDAGVYVALTRAGMSSPAAAKRISFVAGSIWGFFANKFFTFDQRGFSFNEPVLFALVYMGGWVLNSVIHDAVLKLTDMKILAFLAATGVSTCTNFAGQKWIVFRGTSRTA
jgi:putative flippase GtrA